MSNPPPPPPLPPPTAPPPATPPTATGPGSTFAAASGDAGLTGTGKGLIIAGVVVGGLLVVGMLTAIAVPAFLNQRDLANQHELTAALREAALAVEEVAADAGRYDAVPDLHTEVDTLLGGWTDGRVVLDVDSSRSFVTAVDVGLCAEHVELPGSLTYVASEGMHEYVDEPCP